MTGPASTMEELRRAAARDEFKIVSMCTNIGGFEMGAMRAGGRAVLANDISTIALDIHRRNFPQTVRDSRNMQDIAASPAATAAFLAQADLAPGEIDCLTGGSPCNRISTLARRHNLVRSPLDTKRLLFDLANVIRYASPRTAIIENVAALAELHPALLNAVLKVICYDDNGKRCFFAAPKILCASHYAVPQVRRRTFIMVIRADRAEEVGITTDEAVTGIFPDPVTPVPLTIRWALQGVHPTEQQLRPFWEAMMRGEVADLVRQLPLDPDEIVGLPDRRSYFNLERCAWDIPALTLTARGLMPISLSGPLHPSFHRKFCIPEIVRLFGVPDDFDFGWSTAGEAAERLGLMVPPPMAEALFRAILERVLRPYRATMAA